MRNIFKSKTKEEILSIKNTDKFPPIYWYNVSKELEKQLKLPVTVVNYEYGGWTKHVRETAFIIDIHILKFIYDWRRDGTIGKPVTEVTLDENGGGWEVSDELGRYAIWDRPESMAEGYAELYKELKKKMYVYDDDDLDESLNTSRAKVVNEEFIGIFQGLWNKEKDIEVYMNPKTIKRMGKWNRAISDDKGNLFIVDTSQVTHSEIIKYLRKFGYKFNADNHIMWQRYEKGNNFFLSELYDLDDYDYPTHGELTKKVKEKNPKINFSTSSINEPY